MRIFCYSIVAIVVTLALIVMWLPVSRKFSIKRVVIILAIITVIGLLSIMYYSLTMEDDDKGYWDVKGYGEFVFGAAPSNFDFSGWERVDAIKELKLKPGYITTLMVNHEYDFAISAGRTEATIMVGFWDNELVLVLITMDNFGDQDDIIEYGEALRAAIADKYAKIIIDPYSIDKEDCTFITDGQGDSIGLGWDSKGVKLCYGRVGYWHFVSSVVVGGEEKL